MYIHLKRETVFTCSTYPEDATTAAKTLHSIAAPTAYDNIIIIIIYWMVPNSRTTASVRHGIGANQTPI